MSAAPRAVELWDTGVDTEILKQVGRASVIVPDDFVSINITVKVTVLCESILFMSQYSMSSSKVKQGLTKAMHLIINWDLIQNSIVTLHTFTFTVFTTLLLASGGRGGTIWRILFKYCYSYRYLVIRGKCAVSKRTQIHVYIITCTKIIYKSYP